MKKVICLILALVVCISLACPVFATEGGDGFVSSPGGITGGCRHGLGFKLVGNKAPTCYSEGYTGDHVCTECGEVVEKGEVIPVAAHTYENGKCVYCGVEQGAPTTGDNSMLVAWVVVMGVAVVGLGVVTCIFGKKVFAR